MCFKKHRDDYFNTQSALGAAARCLLRDWKNAQVRLPADREPIRLTGGELSGIIEFAKQRRKSPYSGYLTPVGAGTSHVVADQFYASSSQLGFDGRRGHRRIVSVVSAKTVRRAYDLLNDHLIDPVDQHFIYLAGGKPALHAFTLSAADGLCRRDACIGATK